MHHTVNKMQCHPRESGALLKFNTVFALGCPRFKGDDITGYLHAGVGLTDTWQGIVFQFFEETFPTQGGL